jgi:gas vesicle protein
MKNFGLLKSIVENALVKNYKKNNFKNILKEFKELIDYNKSVGKVYVDYGSILKVKNLSEEVATEFIELTISDIKNTIKENRKQFLEFEAWTETLEPISENSYQLLDDLIFADTAEDFLKLVESKKTLKKMLTESNKNEETTLTETINIPLDKMYSVVADTFSNEYSNLSESQLFELKSLMKMTKEELTEGIERLKKEVTEKLDSVDVSDEETKSKIQETKDRVMNTQIDSLSYYKLKELSKGL